MMRAILFTAAICLGGCSAGSAKKVPTDGDQTACRAGCESNIWPRVIVGFVPPEGFVGDEATLAAVHGVFAGVSQDATNRGCPADLPATLHCTYVLYAAPADESFELVVQPNDGETVRQSITLAPFNTCGRSIAYLTVRFEPEGVALSDTRYVNPCAAL
jgi:hypothetical protein